MFVCVFIFLPIFITSTNSYIQIDGELSFDVQLFNNEGKREENLLNDTDVGNVVNLRGSNNESRVTAGAIVECEYQYPERRQLEALLSDMMNQLAQIFVRTKEYDQKEGNRWGKRFRVIRKQDSEEFEVVFKNMTQEYKDFYTTTLNKLNRTGDPCSHQAEIKSTWRALLSRAQAALQRAAAAGAQRVLRAGDPSAQGELEAMVARLVSAARSQQLDALCDRFQLCYDDLLQK